MSVEFETAAREVKDLSTKPSNEDMLLLYGLYKQSTVGDNTAAAPGMFDFTGKAKHAAWLANVGMSCAEAQTKYIAVVARLKM